MKKLNLIENKNVVFSAEEHTYTLQDGTQLSGITSIIHKYLFPVMYSGVSESVLEAARERGHRIHSELELEFRCPELNKDISTPEVLAYRKIAKENKLKQIAAEFLVSDDTHVATCIDSITQVGDNDVMLVDYKTTSVLYEEYLQWQLSIEAYLLEKQTGVHVASLYAVHLPKNGDAAFVEIGRLPDKYVEDILAAYANGDETFVNPLHILGDDTNDMLRQYKDAELSLIELKASIKYYEQIQADIKARIKEQMDSESASKWENDDVTITRGKDSVRRTFKLDLLKEKATKQINKWLDANIDKCYAETAISGNVSIKFK